MSLKIGDNFSYNGRKFNFERDCFATLSDMKNFPEASVPPYGFRTFCEEDKKYYEFSINNEINETTGKWKEVVSTGGGTSNYNDLSNKPQINNIELTGNKSLEDLGIQPKGDYATKEELPDVSDMLTKTEAGSTYQPKGDYLTEIPTEYVTETELEEKGYALKSELPEEYTLPTASDSILGGIKVGAGLSINPETGVLSTTGGGVADSVDWSNITSKPETFKPEAHQHVSSDITDLQDKLDAKQDKGDYALKSELPDVSDILTKTEASSTYAAKTHNHQISEVTDLQDKLDTKADKSEISNFITKDVSDLTNYETSEVANSKYATKEELPDVSDMLTKTEAGTTYQPIGNYVLKSELPEEYTLPIATSNLLGGIKVGAGLSINPETGVLSATGGGVADSVDWTNITSKPETFTPSTHTHTISEITDFQDKLDTKQDKLVSGTNIKTINGQTLLGEGDITIESNITVDTELSETSTNPVQNKVITDMLKKLFSWNEV